jgi:hypothetical protein
MFKEACRTLEIPSGSVPAEFGIALFSRRTQIRLNYPDIGSGTTPVTPLRDIATRVESFRVGTGNAST